MYADPAEYADDQYDFWLREQYDSDLRERANLELTITETDE